MTTSAVAALEVADEKFLVASLIEGCPKSMMIRELMKNAIEAAQQSEPGRRLSMAADDFGDAMQNVRRAIGKALRANRQTSEPLEAGSAAASA